MKNAIDYSLYLCTDRELMSCKTIDESVELALKGGVTVVQLREKNCSSRNFFDLAVRVKRITDYYNVPLIINDRADVALAVDCAGVHVGQQDLPCSYLRKIMGEKIIGVSAATKLEALQAVKDGADYLGVGAMFPTKTKTNARYVSKQELSQIRKAVSLPIVIIGGINKTTLYDFKGMGLDGIAVVSAVVAQPDVEAVAKDLYKSWNNGI